jgi:hypothetical protein
LGDNTLLQSRPVQEGHVKRHNLFKQSGRNVAARFARIGKLEAGLLPIYNENEYNENEE